MLLVLYFWFVNGLDRSRKKQWLGVPKTERCKVQNIRRGLVVDLGEIDFRVDFDRCFEVGGRKDSCCMCAETLAKHGNVLRIHRQTGGLAVAAEFGEQFGHCFQSFQQMERANAAAGALRDAVFDAENEGGPMESLDHAARDDAYDAAMPAIAGENKRCIFVANRLLNALLKDCIGNCLFRLLPILV
jgi:hypothetical protein